MEQLSEPRRHFRLNRPEFERIAAGATDPATVLRLVTAHRNRTMLTIRALIDRQPALVEPASLLGQSHESDPPRIDPLLVHPWLAIWAVDRLRGSTHDGPGYLACAALAAAALTGRAETGVPVVPWRGTVPVPGRGVLYGIHRPVVLRPTDLTGPAWTPARRIVHTHRNLTLALTVDDIDPYRDCFRTAVAPRLGSGAFAALDRSVGYAWRLLVEVAPRYAAELSAGLTTMVPLRGSPASRQSITHADGFGGFAADPHLHPVDLAVTMVHEFQHSKLNALLGLVRLFDPTATERYFAPWRTDPRPVGGLVHGVYAFTAVAEIWQSLRTRPDLSGTATDRLAGVRTQLARALRELDTAPSLTCAGRLWSARLATRIGRLLAVPLPAGVDTAARNRLAATEHAWRKQHA